MRQSADAYLSQVNKSNAVQIRFRKVWRVLSLLVVFCVFWGLKLTGITMAGEAFCGMEEHVHSDACMQRELICALEEIPGHTHTEECRNQVLQCTLPEQEGHTHGETCVTRSLICDREETAGHTHTESCITDTLVCTAAEEAAHFHTEDCFADILACGLEESENHSHDESCLMSQLVCPLEETEGHSHGITCYCLICGMEEEEPHTHGEECYLTDPGYLCGQEEIPAHFHGEECYSSDESSYLCGLEQTEGHSHTDSCYRVLEECPLEEHIHTASCYSDLSADLETSDVWEDSLAELIRSPSDAENILAVARSQLGVAESEKNFQVDENGVRRGITRYGQWYGNPYGDWSAMFVSFCLDYAGIRDIPLNAGPESMRLEWESAQLYAGAADHTPVAGQLLFLDKNEDGMADGIAVITGREETVLFVIEGNLNTQVSQIGSVSLYPEEEPEETDAAVSGADCVMETLYAMDDPAVMGYGLVPFGSGLMLLPEDGAQSRAAACTVWLDGTDGGLMSLGGSPNTPYTTEVGATFNLPTQWQSPEKYSYTLRGWYDVTNKKYYQPGDQVTVTGDMVFYADWEASTYDVGQFNSQVADTISTSDFVTVRMFDYGALINVLSQQVSVSVNGTQSHTETWSMASDNSLNFILRDWDAQGSISWPSDVTTGSPHYPTDAGVVYRDLYSEAIRNAMFDPATSAIGKEYLGEGDHLFQLCLDPNHEHYGYYYYNSERNAASYNQTEQRFYVYDYLECTRTSAGQGNEGKYSDFLPLNSPYANTNGNTVNTYSYGGVEGEYNYTTHYMYDCRYNTDYNSPDYVSTNFWFGMSVEIDFYLPNKPGTLVGDGYGNQDFYGKDMHFQFSGDDDVWVLVDGVMVLDLGGLHGMESGDINFSTGVVTINGVVDDTLTANLRSIAAGEHTLTLYYLERGSSMSNCAIYFNLAPRYGFSIQKEDVLTRDLLNGAQFAVYTDKECETPAQLWTDKASHDRGGSSTNIFTVVNGTASMWGMGAGNTYYIKEVTPPTQEGYDLPDGVIELNFDMRGFLTYQVYVTEDTEGNTTPGFTVHGIRIDEETQEAYIVATNAKEEEYEGVTSVSVKKRWNDNLSHSTDTVTVYLTVKDPDGTVRRIREITLTEQINWTYTWANLPKCYEDGTLIEYSVQEAVVPGYVSRVEEVEDWTQGTGTGGTAEADAFENSGVYLLRTSYGYLSTVEAGLALLPDQESAMASGSAQWSATLNADGTVTLVNHAGYTLYYDSYTFKASRYPETHKNLRYGDGLLYWYYDYGSWQETLYPINNDSVASNLEHNKVLYTTNTASQALPIALEKLVPKDLDPSTPTTGTGKFEITNTPAGDAVTSLSVQKVWDVGSYGNASLYESLNVELKLLANGTDSGLRATANLKNGWYCHFDNLPLYDSEGNLVSYTVEELPLGEEWRVNYGAVQSTGGDRPAYSTTVTNTYFIGGPELPSTGTAARMLYVLCGGSMMLTSLVYGILLRRKRERRMK